MREYITINDVEHDFHHEPYETFSIPEELVIWLGEDYDGNLVVCYSAFDSIRIVRTSKQTIEDVLDGPE